MKNFISNITRVLDLKVSLTLCNTQQKWIIDYWVKVTATEYLCGPRSWLNRRGFSTKFDPFSYITVIVTRVMFLTP